VKGLPGKTRLQNDLLCVERNIKLVTHLLCIGSDIFVSVCWLDCRLVSGIT